MSINFGFFALLLITGAVYLGLFFYLIRRDESFGAERYMAAFSLWSAGFAGAIALTNTNTRFLQYGPGLWLTLISLGGMGILGGLTFRYLDLGRSRWWLYLTPFVLALIFWLNLRDPAQGLLALTWREALSRPGLWLPVALSVIWGLVALALFMVAIISVVDSRLPLEANRHLWWVITLVAVLAGEATAMWGDSPVSVAGQLVRLLGVIIGVYAVTTHDTIDIRNLVLSWIGSALFVIVTSLITLLAISSASLLVGRVPGAQWQWIVIAIVVALALLYQRLQPALTRVVQRSLLAAGYDTAQIVADYSKRIGTILDTGELAVNVGLTLSEAIQATRVALILLTSTEQYTQAEVVIGAGTLPTTPYQFDKASPFLSTLQIARRPLTQYAINYNPQFKPQQPAERNWLQALGADVYVPIYDGEAVSATLAVGPRKTGLPYRARELELLSAIADQTAVALKNARLVTNLRVLNDEMHTLNEGMRMLNKDLAASNERLKEMDKVKSDFINIASHELRTPLTKIRGYTDILSETNRDGVVPKDELTMITDQVGMACDRLDEVVTQLLDASQIDGEAMKLLSTSTTLDAVLKPAIDSITPSLRERGQTIVVQGTHNLPPLQGDYQRLVQTFKELIRNAIKFTPDGGRITIYANHLGASADRTRPEAIEIVVTDSGVGIDPKHHELIFEKFYRVGSTALHSTGTAKFMGAGPGLGLTIARGVIKAHGGQIWVESDGFDPDKCPGSQFHVVLPLAPLNHRPTVQAQNL
jgi:signal transduction histidine kinase